LLADANVIGQLRHDRGLTSPGFEEGHGVCQQGMLILAGIDGLCSASVRRKRAISPR